MEGVKARAKRTVVFTSVQMQRTPTSAALPCQAPTSLRLASPGLPIANRALCMVGASRMTPPTGAHGL